MADDFSGWTLKPATAADVAGWKLQPAVVQPAARAPMGTGEAMLKGVQDIPTMGFGDEAGGAIQAALMALPAGAREALGGSRYDSGDLAANYKAGRDQNRAESKQAAAEHPLAYYGTGVAASLPLAMATGGGGVAARAPLLARSLAGAKTGAVLGAVGGTGMSEADTVEGMAKDAAMGMGGGMFLGGSLPGLGAVGGWAAQTRPAQYVGGKAADAAGYAGNVLKNAAGRLKVNSLHPVPTLGESLADLPGGVAGVGREFIERGIGGATKSGTAKQAREATDAAGKVMGAIAESHDAAGGKPVDLSGPLGKVWEHAAELQKEPTTRSAGDKLGKLLAEYMDIHGQAPVSASQALVFKRTLANEAYGVAEELARSGSRELKPYKKGVSMLERAVNDKLDDTLGPDFGKANLSFRRLLGGTEAAERTAAQQGRNKYIGLHDILAMSGMAGASHSPAMTAATGLTTNLLGKYGAQGGARALHGAGSLLQAAPGVASSLLQGGGAPAQSLTRQAALARLLRELEGAPP